MEEKKYETEGTKKCSHIKGEEQNMMVTREERSMALK